MFDFYWNIRTEMKPKTPDNQLKLLSNFYPFWGGQPSPSRAATQQGFRPSRLITALPWNSRPLTEISCLADGTENPAGLLITTWKRKKHNNVKLACTITHCSIKSCCISLILVKSNSF